MNNVDRISRYGKGGKVHVSMGAKIQEKMAELMKQSPAPKTYYFLKDLTNPIQKYWSVACPDVEMPMELTAVLNQGSQLQNWASPWFRNIPGFSVDEGLLDGAFVGIPGVRGKVDFLIGKSIIELKTKNCGLPNTAEEVMTNYPQDVEQLVFYSVLHPLLPRENYLVFMGTEEPYSIKTFKITTKKPEKIKEIIRKRIQALDAAIKNRDWGKLGKCRYFNASCQFKSSGTCSCDELKAFDLTEFIGAIEIIADDKFTQEVEKGKQKHLEDKSGWITTFDILAPRKRYSRKIMGNEEQWKKSTEKHLYESCLWRAVNNLGYSLNEAEKQSIVDSLIDKRVKIAFKWMRIPSSIHKEGEVLPYLVTIGNAVSPNALRQPSKYHIAQLGTVCALYGKQKGLIITMYPNMDKFVKAFEVNFENMRELRRYVREQVDAIEKMEKTKDFEKLPPCPEFFNKNNECPMNSECHATGKKGCRSK